MTARVLRFRRRDPAYDLPHPALLPASDECRRNILTSYRANGITRICAIDQLIRHCGMSAADANRAVANAIEVIS